MADFTQIIQEINDDINTNGVGAITGAKLNEVLRDMIAAVNDEKQDPLTIDATPNEDSTNPVQSGGVYDELEDKADKVSGATQGNLAGLDSYGNLTDSGIAASDVATTSELAGKQDTINDLADIRSGAAAGATAYQKPSGGIPKTDLASGVQTSLGKADTAVQQVTVGTTTTGNAGTNASVTNSGTATNPVLDFTIPRGADAVNPFKGWWPDLATLKAAHTATAGDSAYVKDASPATTWSIYVYDSTASSNNYWADSGTDADTSNVQTFASSQEVNEVHIVNDLTTGGANDVLSAEQGKELGDEVFEIRTPQVLNTYISGTAWRPVSSVYSSKYIAVKAGDSIHVVKNSERNPQVAFLQSVDITNPTVAFALGYSTVISTISDSVLYVPSDCYFYWMVDYNGQNFEPQVLTINGKSIINQEYKKSYIKELSADSAETTEKVGVLENAFKDMVGVYTKNNNTIDFDDVVANKYWNLVNNVAGLVAASDYFARAELYPVNQGDTLVITVDNSIITDGEGTAAYSAYDNDGLPYNGTNARFNFGEADSFINNGDGTTTYKFIIKNNTSQVGLYYKIRLVSIKLESNPSYSYSESLDEHIEQVAGGGATTAADSAKYYLKGASPKSFTKKICILAAGQSNIDGRVPYANMPAEIQAAQPIANCNYIKNSESGAFAPVNITGLWGFDLVTYYNLCVTANKEIYVIKWSQGGTSIDPLGDSQYHWTADYEELSSEQYSLLRKFESEIRNHIASDGQQFDIRALLWHQGEGDRASLGTGSADRYYDNLRNMVSYIRGIVGNERLPIITGTISHNSSQYDAKIEEAQQRLALEDPYFCLIDMSGAPLLDSYHFNAASSVYFGEMAYNALIDYGVLSATKLTPTKPW